MTDDELDELHYLVGRIVGLRERVGEDIDLSIYHNGYRVRIEKIVEPVEKPRQ